MLAEQHSLLQGCCKFISPWRFPVGVAVALAISFIKILLKQLVVLFLAGRFRLACYLPYC
ncbi:hypothetical protein A1355_23385 [Methylomonas koyamae]|uniref:Uncharacterized protein n=1 Tax=Methylomonas koyamae TaxID=702114 RepID=A0A177NTB9_9GAMM|nr:hypothetical protein A1355_23385 [Methylomonas koyamae]